MTDTSLVSSEARSQGSARDRNCSVLAPATVDDFTSTFLNVKALIPGDESWCARAWSGRVCKAASRPQTQQAWCIMQRPAFKSWRCSHGAWCTAQLGYARCRPSSDPDFYLSYFQAALRFCIRDASASCASRAFLEVPQGPAFCEWWRLGSGHSLRAGRCFAAGVAGAGDAKLHACIS